MSGRLLAVFLPSAKCPEKLETKVLSYLDDVPGWRTATLCSTLGKAGRGVEGGVT